MSASEGVRGTLAKRTKTKTKRSREEQGLAPHEVSGKPRKNPSPTGAYLVMAMLVVLLIAATVLVLAKTQVMRGGPAASRPLERPPLPTPAHADTIEEPAPVLEVPRERPASGAPLLPAPLDEPATEPGGGAGAAPGGERR